MPAGREDKENMKPKQTGRNVGDIYRPVAEVAKIKNGVESVLIIRGIRYVMEHPNQFKGFSAKPKTLQGGFNGKKDRTHQR